MKMFQTFQTENAFPESIHDVLQRWLICHIKEVLVVWVTGDVLNLIEESLGVDSSAVVVAEDLQPQIQTFTWSLHELYECQSF